MATKYNTPSRLFNFNANPPSDGLIAAWNLENVNDSFGANNLTNNNAATFVAAKVLNGVSVNGVNQYLSIVDNANISFGVGKKLSIVGWFKLNAIAAETPIIAKWSAAGQREYMVSATTNKLTFSVTPDGTNITSVSSMAGTITTGVFYFFAVWYDGNKLYLELNADNLAYTTNYSSDIFNGTSELNIGRKQEGAVFTNGIIDAVRLYKHDNRVLTLAERQAIYHNGMGIQFETSNIIASEQMNRELDQLISLFGGFTTDVTPKLSSVSNNTALIVNQNGNNSILQCKANGVLKAEILNNGQFRSYLATGTAPISMPFATAGEVVNLNVDLLDDLEASAFLQTTSYLLLESTGGIDGPLVVNQEVNVLLMGEVIIKCFIEIEVPTDGILQVSVSSPNGTIGTLTITTGTYAEITVAIGGLTSELINFKVITASWSLAQPADLTAGIICESFPVS